MVDFAILLCALCATEINELGAKGVEVVFRVDVTDRVHRSFPGAEWLSMQGEPNVPSCVLKIGIPQHGGVEVQIIEHDEDREKGVDIEPVRYAGIYEPGYQADLDETSPVYRENDYFPATLIEVTDPAVYRELRTVDVQIHPVRYNPVTRELKTTTYVKFRVLFTQNPQPRPITDVTYEETYKRTVANYNQCRTWRRLPPKQAKINPFAAGAWFKIELRDEGLYKIGPDELRDAGINPLQFDPKTMKIYSAYFELLPRNVQSAFGDSLVQIPVYVRGEDDHSFDGDDFLLFYGYGASHFVPDSAVQWYENGYTRDNVYWFTFGGEYGRRMELVNAEWNGQTPSTIVDEIVHLEEDRSNPTRSGTNWYWLDVSPGDGNMASVSINLPHRNALGPAEGSIAFFTLHNGTWRFVIDIDGVTRYDSTFYQAKRDEMPPAYIDFNAPLSGDSSTMIFSIHRPSGTASPLSAFFNSLDLQYTRSSVINEPFHALLQGTGTYSLQCTDAGQSPFVLDITSLKEPRMLAGYDLANNTLTFTTSVDSSHRLLYISKPSLTQPAILIPVAPGKLRAPSPGCEYLVITHPKFYNAIMPLVEYRRQEYSVQVVVVGDIYDDFSYGKYDPLAIKHFLYHTTNYWTAIPTYILLVGDATYDYRNNLRKDNPPNYIPMYEEGTKLSGNPGIPPNFIDEHEYVNFAGGSSMILGRITVRNNQEVRDYIDKVFTYETQNIDGMWNKRIILAGDDEWSNSYGWEGPYQHSGACEGVLNFIPDSLYDPVKVYMVSYKPFTYPCIKPAALEAFVRELCKGGYAGLFLGHGNTNQLADEVLFRHTTIPRIKNGRRFFFYYFGSCTVNRFDDSDYECIGEQFVRIKEGAIGTMGETAGCSPVGNSAIADSLFKYLTQTDLTMGECFNLARREQYLLLGDPAVKMRRNSSLMALNATPDSLRPIDKLHVTADANSYFLKAWVRDTTHIEYFDETTADRISGHVYRWVQSGPSSFTAFDYAIDGKEVYRGFWDNDTAVIIAPRVSVTHLPVVKLSSHTYGTAGMYDSIRMYGTAAPSSDEAGPEIVFYDRGRKLQDNDWVEKEFTLTGKVNDESGINLLNSVYDTRGFYLYVNQELDKKIDLRDYFIYDKNSYTNGEFHVLLTLPEPVDTITVNVTDNHYNQTTRQLVLNAEVYGRLCIENFLIYPNPLRDNQGLWFTFVLSSAGVVDLEIFTIAGRLVRRIENEPCSAGYNQVYWDGRDAYADNISNGVYLVKARARSGSSRDEIVEKFIIAR